MQLEKGLRIQPTNLRLVFATVFVTSDSAIGVGPVRGVFGGVNSAPSFPTFLALVHDALSAWRGMFYSHVRVPFIGLRFSNEVQQRLKYWKEAR